jgi:hypothetical protein
MPLLRAEVLRNRTHREGFKIAGQPDSETGERWGQNRPTPRKVKTKGQGSDQNRGKPPTAML